jgi:hypothetical protein
MFCNRCGKEIQASYGFCGTCGAQIGRYSAPPPASPAAGRVARHVRTLAVLWIALSALNLLRSGSRFLGAHVIGLWGRGWFDDSGWGWPAGDILPAILSTMGMISLVLAVIGFAVGFGLMERRSWGRTLAIVIGIISLLHPLLGTILGIYTLWVLLPAEAEADYRKMSVGQ